MGLPSINIKFKSMASSLIERGQKGVVALVIKDVAANFNTEYVLENATEAPEGLSATNIEYIGQAFMGGISKMHLCIVDDTTPDYTGAYNYLETVKFDYLAHTDLADADKDAAIGYVKTLRDSMGKKVKAVIAHADGADHEAVINFATDDIKVGEKTYTAQEYVARIAGLLAGLSITRSATFVTLGEVDDVTHLTKSELDAAIDAGKFILFHDGVKVKVARGVNSLVTTSEEKGSDFQKIAIVDKMDMISNDINETASDNYIGAVANSYDNKILLISAINGYLDGLVADGILDRGARVDVDINSQIAYLKTIGIYDSRMTVQQIRSANTRDKVFLAATVKPLDAMEDITLNINM